MNEPRLIEELGNADTLISVCVDKNGQYGLLIENRAGETSTVLCETLLRARWTAKSLLGL